MIVGTKITISASVLIVFILTIGIALRVIASLVIPFTAGPDFYGHANYILDLVEGKMPKVEWFYQNEDGYYDTRYHPPLYYSISSVFYILTKSFQISKLVSLAFSLMNLFIIYKTVRILFPDNLIVQFFSLSFVSILPFDIITSSYLNNDSTVEFFSSLAIFFLIARKSSIVRSGILSGLAFLSKFNGVFVLFPILYQEMKNRNWRIRSILILVLIFLLISGGWYLRNYFLYGTPFPIWTYENPPPFKSSDYLPFSRESVWYNMFNTGFLTFIQVEDFSVLLQEIGFVFVILTTTVGMIYAFRSEDDNLKMLAIYSILFLAFFILSSFSVFNKGIFVARLLTPIVLPLSIFFGIGASREKLLLISFVVILMLITLLIPEVLSRSFNFMVTYEAVAKSIEL